VRESVSFGGPAATHAADPPPPSPLPSLQTGREKRALKFAKRKLGTHSRGKAKRDEVTDILRKKK